MPFQHLTKQKILKIKVGDVYINGKNYPIFETAWRKESKKGGVYYEARIVAFPGEIDLKEKIEEVKIRDVKDI